MDRHRPNPAEASRPQSVPDSPLVAGSGTRKFGFLFLMLLVLMGGWVRFSDQIGQLAPGLVAPVQADASGNRVRALLELGLTPIAASAAATQAMNLPSSDQAALQLAIDRRRLRLVQLPLFERDGGTGATVEVNANGLTRVISLGAEPVVLSIPIAQVGTVTFRLLGGSLPGGVGIGAITLTGPMALPTLSAGQTLSVGVVAQ